MIRIKYSMPKFIGKDQNNTSNFCKRLILFWACSINGLSLITIRVLLLYSLHAATLKSCKLIASNLQKLFFTWWQPPHALVESPSHFIELSGMITNNSLSVLYLWDLSVNVGHVVMLIEQINLVRSVEQIYSHKATRNFYASSVSEAANLYKMHRYFSHVCSLRIKYRTLFTCILIFSVRTPLKNLKKSNSHFTEEWPKIAQTQL